MNSSSTGTELLHSPLAEDPDLREIVEMFVEEMPDRVANLLALLESSNWEELRRAAHKLKGAAGSYGFHAISPAADLVEVAIHQSKPEEEIYQAVDELVDLCRRATADVPG